MQQCITASTLIAIKDIAPYVATTPWLAYRLLHTLGLLDDLRFFLAQILTIRPSLFACIVCAERAQTVVYLGYVCIHFGPQLPD